MSLYRRIANLFSRSSIDREIDAELRSHIDLRIEDNLASGMNAADARRDALVRFGNPAATKEHVAGMDVALLLASIASDIRYACRQLIKNPGFASTAILVLSLGIGSSVAIFAFVDAALIKPLPYREPARLVALFESMSLGPRFHISYQDYLDWKRTNQVFSALELYDGIGITLNTPAGAQPIDAATVSDGFFRTLGVAPILGRDFVPGEDLPSAPRTVLLSYASWQSRYGGRPDVLGQSVTLEGNAYTIVGVLPRDFHFALVESPEFWVTLHAGDGCAKDRGCHSMAGIARLKDGVTLQAAAAAMTAIADQLARQYPDADAARGATVLPLSEVIVGGQRPILLLLLAGASLLTIIACVNVASLLLVRSECRKREIAVRGALGASAARLVRQLVTEGLVLVAAGSTLGLASALVVMRLLLRLIPTTMLAGMPYLRGIGLNQHVAAFTLALSLIASVLFSVLPAMRLSLSATASGLRDGLASGGRGFAGAAWRRFGSNLVAIELATAMVLLVGAGLLGKSFYRLLHADVGLQPDHLAALRVAAPDSGYANDAQVVALEKRVVARIAELPGIVSVGTSGSLPIGNGGGSVTFRVIGRPYHGERIEVNNREIGSGYFATIGARLLRGRNFTDADDASKPGVMIINRAMANKHFPGEDPLGKQIAYDASSPAKQIVGIVDDIREGPLDSEVGPALYVPFDQEADHRFFVVVRTAQDEKSLLSAMAAAIRQIDPNITTSQPTTMNQRIHDSPAAYLHRSSAWLVSGFAAMALILGVVGVYGVIAYSVSQRTREIGVRMALGASRKSVYQLILGEAGGLVALGIAAGLVSSVIAATLMRKLLFATEAWDAPTLAGVALLLAVSALLASYIPARRAASVNPTEALRAD
jgi:predicted permease